MHTLEDSDILLEENAALKEIITKLETDKSKLKLRIQELSEENVLLLRRQQDNSTIGGSDREDSPNLLSELDKQEELLANISSKNKHIKRLLREIEAFESESIKSAQQIELLENTLAEATQRVSIFTAQLEDHKRKLDDQQDVIDGLNLSVQNLTDQMGVMDAERSEREGEIHEFGRRLEKRAIRWRQLLEEKDDRLDSLRIKYEDVLKRNPGYDIDADRVGLQQMAEAVAARDFIIADLEDKVTGLSQEMIETTQLLNSLSREREMHLGNGGAGVADKIKNVCNHCADKQSKLDAFSVRCADLQAIVSNLEEDNLIKSRQTFEAQRCLSLLRSGEEGLSSALARNMELQTKIDSRDKHVRTLVAELNILQQTVHENEVLRQRLGIEDDEIVSTTAYVAKKKKNEQITERLKLKLRASEEIRLQLKLDKNYLKRQLEDLKQRNSNPEMPSDLNTDNTDALNKTELQSIPHQLSSAEHEERYAIVVEENENLRIGMHEILEQLRNYEAQADHIVIDTSTLEKLLHALDARSISGWYHPAMRLQNELIAAKEREVTLLQRVRLIENHPKSIGIQSDTFKQQKEQDSQTNAFIENAIPNLGTSLDMFFEQISARDVELERLRSDNELLNERNRELLINVESIQQIEEQFDDLTRMLATSENEQNIQIAAYQKDILSLKTKYNQERRKHQFVCEDFSELSLQHKSLKNNHNKMIHDLRKLFANREHAPLLDSTAFPISATDYKQSIEEMENELVYLKAKMVRTVESSLGKFVDFESIANIELNLLVHKKGVIQEDLSLNYITEYEWSKLWKKCEELEKQNSILDCKNKQFDELLRMAESQVETLQRELAERCDEDMTARHLIVDLQSQGQEQYLIAKMGRDLHKAQQAEEEVRRELNELREIYEKQTAIVQSQLETNSALQSESEQHVLQNDLKLRFLTKSYEDLRQQFAHITPLYPLLDFMRDYAEVLLIKAEMRNKSLASELLESDQIVAEVCQRIEKSLGHQAIEDKLQIIKYETHQVYLEEKLKRTTIYFHSVQNELDELKLRTADWSQHWDTIQLLFGEKLHIASSVGVATSSKISQTNTMETIDTATNTEQQTEDIEEHTSTPKAAPRRAAPPVVVLPNNSGDLSLASQLKQAMYLASTRSALLLEHENRLAVAHARVRTLEKIIEERGKIDSINETSPQSPRKDDHILSVTIASLQTMIQEKEASLIKYQEMLRDERQHVAIAYENQRKEVKQLQATIDGLRDEVRLKEQERVKETPAKEIDNESMPDTFVEEMFLEDRSDPYGAFNSAAEMIHLQTKLQDAEDESRKLHGKLREVSLREGGWERTMCEKDKEIEELKERMQQMELNEHDVVNAGNNRRDIDQLREMLDEKDRHINDLTETLTSFHDDQQKFIHDTSLHTAEQVSQLSADLSRFETTNRILNTQLDALKRQLASVGQRESQAREMIKTLKNQLIRRPVISLKSASDARSTTNREEHLQKRVHQLDNELQTTREELRKQSLAAQCKRNKDATELGLWSKQKRFQQMADNLKDKLTDRENELEKLKTSLSTSKTVIARLEREKNILNDRLSRVAGQQQRFYCQYPSCPSLHLSKITVGESPSESCGTTSHQQEFRFTSQMMNKHQTSTDSARSKPTTSSGIANQLDISDNNQDIIEAQQSRIETQQRKIVAMELEGRGHSALCQEIERLQEKLSAIDAQNIRLEAKNLHLQLNNDIIQQGDQSEKTQRQIKYLEDYIITLKSELALTRSQIVGPTTTTTGANSSSEHTQHLEQTVLAMRRVLERLKAENKCLKDAKGPSSKDAYEKLRTECGKIQNSYSEALDKISALKIELEIQTGQCANCKNRIHKTDESSSSKDAGDPIDITDLKDKLIKKTQLLEKAKILLSRAAAKEKQYRDQITHWKRRCSELQNVPIIEEESMH